MTILAGESKVPPWFTDTNRYTLYDDFGDASIDAAKWLVQSNTGTIAEAGGQINMSLDHNATGAPYLWITSKIIPAGRSVWVDAAIATSTFYQPSAGIGYVVGNSTDGFTSCFEPSFSGSSNVSAIQYPTGMLVVYKGGNLYDVYVGQQLKVSNLSLPNGAQISIRMNPNQYSTGLRVLAELYEVRHSNT